jgi:hypothetical protein
LCAGRVNSKKCSGTLALNTAVDRSQLMLSGWNGLLFQPAACQP